MKRSELTNGLALCWLLCAATVSTAAVTGTAYAVGSERVLYLEHYDFDVAPEQWQVEYHLADNTPLATKRLDFSPGAERPNYLLRYHDSERTTGARWQNQDLLLFNKGEKVVSDVAGELVVIDAGFDNFVRNNWQQLAQQTLQFQFAFASDLRLVPLQIQQVPAGRTPLSDTTGATFFRIEGATMLLRWFSEPIYLAYNGERELCIYQGISNLSIAGETPQVRIIYRNQDSAAPLC